jgi:hypothetical protein
MKLGELRSKTAHLPDDIECFTDDMEYGIEDFNIVAIDLLVDRTSNMLYADPPAEWRKGTPEPCIIFAHCGWKNGVDL